MLLVIHHMARLCGLKYTAYFPMAQVLDLPSDSLRLRQKKSGQLYRVDTSTRSLYGVVNAHLIAMARLFLQVVKDLFPPEQRHGVQFVLDTQQLVVLADPIGAAE